jgi:hypothetical protein
MSRLHDKSTEAIKRKLVTPQPRNPVTSHAGVASVGSPGAKPRQHDCDGDCAGPDNDALNAQLAQSSAPTPRKQPSNGELVAAGIITPQ